jgi:hypothetical protein
MGRMTGALGWSRQLLGGLLGACLELWGGLGGLFGVLLGGLGDLFCVFYFSYANIVLWLKTSCWHYVLNEYYGICNTYIF